MKRKDQPCGPYYAQNPLTLIMRIRPEQVNPEHSNVQMMKAALIKAGLGGASLANDAKIHFARFVFLENDTQMGVITSYDFSFEDYIFTFLKNFGELFDDLFQYVIDPPPSPVREFPEAFGDYVYRNDVKPFVFFGAYEDLSVANILNQFGRIARDVTLEKPTKPAEIPTPP
ncbi:MAG TPA: hypothetical protein VEQ60_16460, partial [Longimicrobium sp.]|nr:hypothetical protein [Longimicrobium sp.]